MREIKQGRADTSMDEQGSSPQTEKKERKKCAASGNRRQVTWEEYRDIILMCRNGIQNVKALMEQDLVRDAKNNKKLFCKYTMSEKKGQGDQ